MERHCSYSSGYSSLMPTGMKVHFSSVVLLNYIDPYLGSSCASFTAGTMKGKNEIIKMKIVEDMIAIALAVAYRNNYGELDVTLNCLNL